MTEEFKTIRIEGGLDVPSRAVGQTVYATDDMLNEFYGTWEPPQFPPSPSDIFHDVESGEEGFRGITLIAYWYYGRPDLWWIIASVNGITNPTRDLRAGMVLRVPARHAVLAHLV